MFDWLGKKIAIYLQKPSTGAKQPATCSSESLVRSLRKGDVLLVDGASRVSTAIKYLTQSTWSHAALCIQDQSNVENPSIDNVILLEADVVEGVRIVSVKEYTQQHTRICRPVGLSSTDVAQMIAFAKERLGHQYDRKNVIDLMRYLVQTPPVPVGWRRSMLKLGSGDPTRAICSTLIAQSFQSIKYPILPVKVHRLNGQNLRLERLFRVRHHTLFVPRDFDISPYFNIIKPSLQVKFDHHSLKWLEDKDSNLT